MARTPIGMHPEDIKAVLRRRFGFITDLSVEWGYDRSAISNTLVRPNYSQPVELRIAQALGLHPHAIWPDRWTAEGIPMPRKTARIIPLPQRQKRNAA